MNQSVTFETPENIEVSYHSAGSGTRFVAWFVDSLLIFLFSIALFFVLVCAGAASDSVLRQFPEPLTGVDGPQGLPQLQLVFVGIWLLVWGLGSFVYFGLSELFLRGQTIGKRSSKIRVVKVDGFSLDPISILIRNLFRVVDQLPPLWIVPVLSAKSQRLGDMVAGTIVVNDDVQQVSNVREVLGSRSAQESRFRFDAATLRRARPQDFTAIERILERWHDLDLDERETLTDRVVSSLAERLKTEVPTVDDRARYLEDLLAAEYRRQNRNLG